MDKKEEKIGPKFTLDTIKIMSEAIGIPGMPEEALIYLADDATFRLQQILQEAVKFTRHGKRIRLSTDDIDMALKVKNIEPLYGFHSQDYIPFRLASGGGRDVYFNEPKELELQELISRPLPKLPLDATLRCHWLAIDGQQPSIPENPPPISRETQKVESVEAGSKENYRDRNKSVDPSKLKVRLRSSEHVVIKDISVHELSVEQQLYFREITEACVGSEETRRSEALSSLASDPGLHQMLPRFCNFIAEGVMVNVSQNNLALLIYLMRMVKSLMENSSLYLEKYLHEFIPAILSCIVSKQLCLRPEADNHWALRDFSTRQMSLLCKMFSNSTNKIQTRITKIYHNCLLNASAPLSTHYGAFVGLCELGHEVMQVFCLPLIKPLGERIRSYSEVPLDKSQADKVAAEHVKQSILKFVPPMLKSTRSQPDNLEEYKSEFGYLGPSIHVSVVKLRMAPTTVAGGAARSVLNVNRSAAGRSATSVQPKPQGQKLLIVGARPQAMLSASGSLPTTPTAISTTPKIVVVAGSQSVSSPLSSTAPMFTPRSENN